LILPLYKNPLIGGFFLLNKITPKVFEISKIAGNWVFGATTEIGMTVIALAIKKAFGVNS